MPFEFHDFISKMDKERRESVESSSFDRSERKKLMTICSPYARGVAKEIGFALSFNFTTRFSTQRRRAF